MKRWLRRVALALVVLGAAGYAAFLFVDEAIPASQPDPKRVDDIAKRFAEVVNLDAWANTGAVRWSMGGRRNHVWDRQRGFAAVHMDDVSVLLSTADQTGIVLRGDAPVTGDEAAKLLSKAYSWWINDSFWLNPIAKIDDPGVERSVVKLDDGRYGLFLRYTSGGTTPGDSYLWIPDTNGVPEAWKMWTSIIPVGGIRVTWDKWQTLATGAKVATLHEMAAISFELTDVEGAETITGLFPDGDPFAELTK